MMGKFVNTFRYLTGKSKDRNRTNSTLTSASTDLDIPMYHPPAPASQAKTTSTLGRIRETRDNVDLHVMHTSKGEKFHIAVSRQAEKPTYISVRSVDINNGGTVILKAQIGMVRERKPETSLYAKLHNRYGRQRFMAILYDVRSNTTYRLFARRSQRWRAFRLFGCRGGYILSQRFYTEGVEASKERNPPPLATFWRKILRVEKTFLERCGDNVPASVISTCGDGDMVAAAAVKRVLSESDLVMEDIRDITTLGSSDVATTGLVLVCIDEMEGMIQ